MANVCPRRSQGAAGFFFPPMTPDILPDSRARITRGSVFRGSQEWVPVFCANCGHEGPLATATSTHLFWMCNPCFASKGHITGTMVVPDQAYYTKVAHEQLETFGRYLCNNELQQVIAEDCTPLATLLKEAK
jgi:hypothetical protein